MENWECFSVYFKGDMNIFTKRSKEKKQIHHAASPIEINNLKVLGVPLKVVNFLHLFRNF